MRTHLMGIGGSGVSAIARVYAARGDDVTGCDAKESDGSLVQHHPKHALVSNIDFDHADHYTDIDDVVSVFQRFFDGLDGSGVAVLCADDERAAALTTKARRVTYGFAETADYRCERA